MQNPFSVCGIHLYKPFVESTSRRLVYECMQILKSISDLHLRQLQPINKITPRRGSSSSPYSLPTQNIFCFFFVVSKIILIFAARNK